MTTHETQLVSDLAKMAIHSYGTQAYSANAGKKVGPAVPPKPHKKAEEPEDQPIYANCSNVNAKSGSQQHIYSNYVSSSSDGVQYAGVGGGGGPAGVAAVRGSMHPPPTDLSGHHPQHPMPTPPPPASVSPGGCSSYATFRPDSSASSYDSSSIYEPINPRPASQMSNRSAYSMASGGGSSLYSSYYPQVGTKGRGGTLTRPHGKEAEVDHLTDLLVQSMENSGDPDFFGMCHKCGEKVLGEGSGCTAMDQVYHIACFTCHICQKELRGKPFFAMDGLPYCEEDYLNTLEKCCVCWKPILDRILRATGKPYHPGCFSCVVCGKCLDGIPFTVDATNQIHCIDDFHKKFAPRCCVCNQPIMPEAGQDETVRVVALDRSFHVSCYRCEDCGLQLSSEAEGRGCYPMDDHILCRSCNAKRVQALSSCMTTEL